MSSTTERVARRGQTLVLFALALVVLFGFAALAFDLGQAQLDRRTEQNAADAAALAGARYIVQAGCYPSLVDCSDAVDEAMRIAYQNGFGAGPTGASNGIAAGNGTTVTVHVPPVGGSPAFRTAGYIEVDIGRSRPSIFAAVLGIATQRTGVLAIASNLTGVAADFAMLALDEHACPSADFSGGGEITVGGNIQVNSDGADQHNCPGAFNAVGTTDVTVTAENAVINVHGPFRCQGNADCVPDPMYGPYVPDPLLGLPAPAVPSTTGDVVRLAGSLDTPESCPGGSAEATAEDPALCDFNSSYAGTTWLLSPGYYPGGLKFQAGTFFLLPGVYYIAGGGLDANGSGASVYSVKAGWNSLTAPTTCTLDDFTDCGGVLIYNTDDPAGSGTNAELKQIALNGSGQSISLYPIQNAGPYTGIVIFQDRILATGGASGDLQLNGDFATLSVVGAIYVPSGLVHVNGTGNLGTAQVIANQFSVEGSGTLSVDYRADVFPQLHAVGLVE